MIVSTCYERFIGTSKISEEMSRLVTPEMRDKARAGYISRIAANPFCFHCKDKVFPPSAYLFYYSGESKTVCPGCASSRPPLAPQPPL